jgi:hypothetical protein
LLSGDRQTSKMFQVSEVGRGFRSQCG